MFTLDGNQGSNASMNAPSTNTRKRRIACDNCHFSKVRCTGEISGCQRCDRGHKICHYSESNMGRTPAGGVKKRHKPSTHMSFDVYAGAPYMQQRQSGDWDSMDPSEVNSSELQDDQPQPSVSEDGESLNVQPEDAIGIWDLPTAQRLPRQWPSSQSLSAYTRTDPEGLGIDPLITTFDDIYFSDVNDGRFAIEESLLDPAIPQLAAAESSRSSSTAPQKHSQQPQIQLQTTDLPSTPSSTPQSFRGLNGANHTPGAPRSSKDGGWNWTTQLEGLSRTLQKSPVPLDGTLYHSSQLLPDISEFIVLADVSSSATNIMLILVCLTQLVTLLELCIPPVLADCSAADSSDLSRGFGDFQVDRKAQQALQVHIVSKELSSMLQVSKLIRQTLRRAECRDVSKRTHELLLGDLQLRIVVLVDQVKQKRGASRLIDS